jgi:hypothetical protein
MNIVSIDKNNNKIVSSSYLLEYCDVWYDKLCNYMQRLINHELLLIIIFEKNHKCEICEESKLKKSSF